MLLNQMLI